MDSRCKDCPFAANPSACGVGNPKAKIAIVGRNPGREEAKTGIPFVGMSGKLLDGVLSAAGLIRDDLWITNASLDYFGTALADGDPPDNAYTACRPRLIRELREVDPMIVLTLGGEASQSLLQTGRKITEMEGALIWNEELGKYVIPTWHPAYIVRGMLDAFDGFLSAIKRAAAFASGVVALPDPHEKHKIHYITTIEEAHWTLAYIAARPGTYAIDTETASTPKDRWNLMLVQIGTTEEAWVFEATTLMDTESGNSALFQFIITDVAMNWVFHNAAYDLMWLWHHWGVKPFHFDDTMALALCKNEKGRRVGLKMLVRQYENSPDYEAEVHKYLPTKDTPFSAVPRNVLVPYAGKDVIFTSRLLPVLESVVAEEDNRALYDDILKPAQAMFAEWEYRGVRVDLDYVKELRAEYYPKRDALIADLQQAASDMGFHPSQALKGAKAKDKFNPGSPTQIMYICNRYLKIRTKTSDNAFLEDYGFGEPFLRDIQTFRQLATMLSKYVEGIADDTWADGRCHPSAWLGGTDTGRLVIKNPELLTLPRPGTVNSRGFSSIRKLFIPSDGMVWLHSDYAQLELRVAAELSRDQDMINAIMSTDFHRTVAAAMYKKPYDKITVEERHNAKYVVFGINYDRGAASLARGQLQCTPKQAQKYIDDYFKRFPVFAKWRTGIQDEAIRTGELRTVFGRKRRWGLIASEKDEAEIRRQAINFIPQSTATDMCMIAALKIHEAFRGDAIGYTLFTVHDSIECEVYEDRIEEASEIVRHNMEHALDAYREPAIAFEVDLSTGKSMGDCA